MKTITKKDRDFVCDINAVCFQDLSAEEAKLVSGSKTQVRFRKGENLTKQGAFASYVLFIIDGLAKQYVEDDIDRNFNLRILGPGDFAGLSSVFTKESFSYSTSALTDTLAFLIEKEAIEKIIKKNGLFAYSLVRRYCRQNSELFGILRNSRFRQTNGNLAGALLYLDGFRHGDRSIFGLLSRKDIADFAGISTESAIKLLKAYEKEKILTLKEKDITIKNRDRLDEISRNG